MSEPGGTVSPSRAPPYATLAIVLLMGLFAALVIHFSTEVVDDAFISFRYAKNLALGRGLVFNPGQRVEGYTNFSWVLAAAVFCRVGVDPVVAMPVVGAVCALAAILVTARGARALAAEAGELGPLTGVPAACVIALTPTLVYYAGAGLETALVVLLYALAGSFIVERRPVAFALVAASACLTRPEAGLLALMGLAVFTLEKPAKGLLVAAVGCAVVVPYLAWKLCYFGTIVPNTFLAKLPRPKEGALYVLHALPALAGLVLAALLFAKVRARRVLLIMWGVHVLAVAAEGGDWMPGNRLLVPALPWLAMAADAPILALARWPRRRSEALRPVLFAMALAYVPLSLRLLPILADRNVYFAYWVPLHTNMAHVLVRAGVKSVAAVDIGALGYAELDLRILDLAGLTDRVIGASPGFDTEKTVPIEYVAEHAPDAVLLLAWGAPEEVRGGMTLRAYHYGADRSLAETRWFHDHYRFRDWIEVTSREYVYWFERVDAQKDAIP